MDTRTHILAAALRLFNERGTDAVTVRQIAADVGISHGNLCYHFANTEVLVQRLYEQLVERLNAVVDEAVTTPQPTLQYLFELTRRTFGILYEYRFFMLDFAAIVRRVEPIRLSLQLVNRRRLHQFRALFETLVDAGLMRPEPLPGHFDRLGEQISLFGQFWINDAAIWFEGPEEHKLPHYLELYFAFYVPYLTEKGLAEYRALDFS